MYLPGHDNLTSSTGHARPTYSAVNQPGTLGSSLTVRNILPPPRTDSISANFPQQCDTLSTGQDTISPTSAQDRSAAYPAQCGSSSAEQASNTAVSARDQSSSNMSSDISHNRSSLQETVALLQEAINGGDQRSAATPIQHQTSLVRDRLAQFEHSQGYQSPASSRMSNSVCSFHTLQSTE